MNLKVHVNPKIQVFLNTCKSRVTDATHTHRMFGFCCILVACFRSKIAPSWMWKMYVIGETLNYMDIVVLWCFGRWIGDTRVFSTANWRLDTERVLSLSLFLYLPTVKTHKSLKTPQINTERIITQWQWGKPSLFLYFGPFPSNLRNPVKLSHKVL